ncbi:DUF6188 family protein [Saccharopolyspora kobensis]|uniref:DUF6188 family protein n=1 Tax=Saccharopolyspora kobensis TaxID=146035 RepID=UPI0011611D24|nr:DUF6188 family protein [Saccharopolyspora kobensis]
MGILGLGSEGVDVVAVDLNLQGQSVVQVCFDASLMLRTSGDYELRIETEVLLQLSVGDQVSFDPESPGVAAAHLVELARDVIGSAEVRSAGDLVIGFERSGMTLNVAPNDDYESWGLVGPGGKRVTCMPGGEIAVWSDSGIWK